MSKPNITDILEKADFTKDKSRDDISLYEVDLRPAGYNTVITVHGKDKRQATAAAKEYLEASVENPMMPDLPPLEK